jgi:hypothetical protein
LAERYEEGGVVPHTPLTPVDLKFSSQSTGSER